MKNYLLFIIDSLNYSHIKESEIELMPFYNSLRKDSIVCENMFSQAPYTEAAVMNIYCGQNVLDYGGYLKRFKDTPKTIFEALSEQGYTTFFNTLQPQCYPSSLSRGCTDAFYNVGFDIGALWSYRVEHYSKLYSKNLLNDKDYEDLIDIFDDNFKEWISFTEKICNRDISCEIIQENSENYDADAIKKELEKEHSLYLENKKEYIIGVMIQGPNHSFLKIQPFTQGLKIKEREDMKSMIGLFKPIIKEVRRKLFKLNIKNNRDGLFSGVFKKFKDLLKKPNNRNFKDFLKSIFLVVNVLYDIDLKKRESDNYDRFKNAPSAKTHIDHYVSWAEKNKCNKHFACIHVDDIHNPEVFFTYDSNERTIFEKECDIAREVLDNLPSDYKGSITHDLSLRYIDNVLEYLFDVLKQKALLEDTCVIITADHGFSFSGNPLRDSFVINLYLENYNVPFLIYNSGYESRVIDDIKTTKDIPATICDLAFGKIPECYTGHSLLREYEYPYVLIEYCGGGCPDLSRRQLKVAAFDKEWFVGTLCSIKEGFSFEKITEIYNLKTDPLQKNNLKGKCSYNDVEKYINAISQRYTSLSDDIK